MARTPFYTGNSADITNKNWAGAVANAKPAPVATPTPAITLNFTPSVPKIGIDQTAMSAA